MADSQVRLADQQEDKKPRGTEGSRSVAEILGNEAGVTGAALTGNAATSEEGKWQYSPDGGRSWSNLPTDISNDGQSTLLLKHDSLVRFAPAENYNGSPGELSLSPLSESSLPWADGQLPYGNERGFIAAWQSSNQDGSGNGIYAQRYGGDGEKLGNEFRVNSTTQQNQSDPSIKQLADGRTVIAWYSYQQNADGNWNDDIYGQVLAKDGSASGPEFKINSYGSENQSRPAIAALNDGGFVVTWQSYNQDGNNWGIYAQRFDSSGEQTGEEVLVNTTTSGEQRNPSITTLANGDYIISFQGNWHEGGNGWDIYAQRFTAAGERTGGEVRLNQTTGNTQEEADISALKNGGYVATWASHYQTIDGEQDSQRGVIAAIFDNNGDIVGEEFRVNTETSSDQRRPKVSELTDGSFVITWDSNNQDGSQQGVYAQRFDSNGTKIGQELPVNTHTVNGQSEPDISALNNGGYLVTWTAGGGQDGSSNGVYGQRFKADGSKEGAEFRLNSYTSNNQNSGEVASYGQEFVNLSDHQITELADSVSLAIDITSTNDRPQLTSEPVEITGAATNQDIVSFGSTDLLSGYTDVDGDSLSISGDVTLVDATTGVLAGNTTDGWTFTPADGFNGTVDLNYTVSDGTASFEDQTSFTIGSGNGGNGDDSANTIIGTDNDDTIDAKEGTDIVDGMGGDDDIQGGDGNDIIRGGSGNDQIQGGGGNDIIRGGSGNDQIQGGGGNDVLEGQRGNDLLEGGEGTDAIAGQQGNDKIDGGTGSDQLSGGEGNDLIIGGDGDDQIEGGAGNDWLAGGNGIDEISGGVGDDIIIVNDYLKTADTYDGGEGVDILIAGSENTSNYGNEGKGSDLTGATITNIESLGVAPAHWRNSGSYGGEESTGIKISADQLNSFEQVSIYENISGNFGDSTTELSSLLSEGSYQYSYLQIIGAGSVNLSDTRFAVDSNFRLIGDESAQNFQGDSGGNWLNGGAGDDVIKGMGGADNLYGGAGDDTIEGNSGDDFITPGSGTDVIHAGDNNDTVELLFSGNTTNGKTGAIEDTIDGGSGNNDTLRITTNNSPNEVDLRNADLQGFEKLEIDTSANIRIGSQQFAQFESIVAASGFNDEIALALDVAENANITFAGVVGLNQAEGAFNLTGTSNIAFDDRVSINTDSQIDLTQATLSSVEGLDISKGELKIDALKWNQFDEITTKGGSAKKIIITDSAGIDLGLFSSTPNDGNTTIELSLSAEQINSQTFKDFAAEFAGAGQVILTATGSGNITLPDNNTDILLTAAENADINLLTGDNNDIIRIGSQSISTNTGAGEDTILLDPSVAGEATIGGGEGSDRVTLGRAGKVYSQPEGYKQGTISDEESAFIEQLMGSSGAAVEWEHGYMNNTSYGTYLWANDGETARAAGFAVEEKSAWREGGSWWADYTFVTGFAIDMTGTSGLNSGAELLAANTSTIFDLTNTTFEEIEVLNIGEHSVELTSAQFNQFSIIEGDGKIQLTTGGDVETSRQVGNFELLLSNEATNLIGTSENDYFILPMDKVAQLSLDGGSGQDTVELRGAGTTSFDALQLSSIEEIKLAGANLELTDQQLDNTTITGNGALLVSDSASTTLGAVEEGTTPNGLTGAELISEILIGTNDLIGAAVTGNGASESEGQWQYSVNEGRSWSDIPSDLQVDGSASLLLQANTYVRFEPGEDFNGTPGSLNLVPLTTQSSADQPWADGTQPYGDQAGFISVWRSDQQDGSSGGIYGQRIGGDGKKIGAEFRINSVTSHDQSDPAITQLSNGNYIVTWQGQSSDEDDNNTWDTGIYGQIITTTGEKHGAEFLVNTTTANDQNDSDIAPLPGGGFVAAWESHNGDESGYGVISQRFTADGKRSGNEIIVNTTESNDQTNPSITLLTNGNYVISYQGNNHENGEGWDVFARSFKSNGVANGDEFRLNDTKSSNQENPELAALNDGGFIATWQTSSGDGNSWGIAAQRYDQAGNAVGDETIINSYTLGEQREPKVTSLKDGSYVVVWQSYNQDDHDWGIFGQHLNADGSKKGTEFKINTHANNTQQNPQITAKVNGGYVVSWESNNQDGNNYGIYAQQFDQNSNKSGKETQVNTYTLRAQTQADISAYGETLHDLSTLNIADDIKPIAVKATVTQTNDFPVLSINTPDLGNSDEGTSFSFTASDLLSGYSDIDGDELTIEGPVSLVEESTGTLNGNPTDENPTGGWTFTPTDGFKGTVSLAFGVNDGTVTVNDHTSFRVGEGTDEIADDQANILIGTNAADNIDGKAGTDVIDGMGGNDDLSGGDGRDIVRGGTGDDVISGGGEADQLFGGSGSDVLEGGGGSDVLMGQRGDDILSGGDGIDVLSGDVGDDRLDGGSDSDELKGGAGNDLIEGGAGDDVVEGGAGNDWLVGGTGIDQVSGDSGDDVIVIQGASAEDDIYRGGEGRDVLVVGSEDNSSYSDSGKGTDLRNANISEIEVLELRNAHHRDEWRDGGTEGSGILITASQLNEFEQVSTFNNREGLFGGEDYELSDIMSQGTSPYAYIRIEGEGTIDLNTTKFDGTSSFRLIGDGTKQNFSGNDQGDWLVSKGGDDTIHGLGGNDSLYGGSGLDSISGGLGDDHIEAGSGDDVIRGMGGDDYIKPGSGSDNIDGGAGNDIVEVTFSTDTEEGKQGAITDVIKGGDGNDVLRLLGSDANEIDLRSATITEFETIEVGTSANIRIRSDQYTQFENIRKAEGFSDPTNFALDLTENESLTFASNVGLNSAEGAFTITGTGLQAFNDTLIINTDTSVDLTSATLNSVEALQLNRGELILNADQWNEFKTITARGDNNKKVIVGESEGIDLSKFQRLADSNTTLEIGLTADQINSNSFTEFAEFFSSSGNLDLNVLDSGTVNIPSNTTNVQVTPTSDKELTIQSGDSDDILRISTAKTSADSGGGNDTILLDPTRIGSIEIDGGAGNDILKIGQSGGAIENSTGFKQGNLNSQESTLLNDLAGAAGNAVKWEHGRFKDNWGTYLWANEKDAAEAAGFTVGDEQEYGYRESIGWGYFYGVTAAKEDNSGSSGYSTTAEVLQEDVSSEYDFTTIDIKGIEELSLNGQNVVITTDQLSQFEIISGQGSIKVNEGGRIPFTNISDGIDLKLDVAQDYNFIGSEGEDTFIAGQDIIDYTGHTFTSVETLDVNGQALRLSADQFNSFSSIIGSGSIQLTTGGDVQSDRNHGVFDLKLSDDPTNLIGTEDDDTIRLDVAKISGISIDGGEGADKLQLTGSGTAALNDLQLTSIESIEIEGASITLTEAEREGTQINGKGALHITDGTSKSLNTVLEGSAPEGATGARTVAEILEGTNNITGAALTGNASTPDQGSWQYSANEGRTWSNIPRDLRVDGSASLLVKANTMLRFAPGSDFNGTPGSLNLTPLTTEDGGDELPWADGVLPYGDQQGFIAVWRSDYQDGSSGGIYGQRHSGDGGKVGKEFRINRTGQGEQSEPDVTQLKNGDLLVTWDSYVNEQEDGTNTHDRGIIAQLVKPDGTLSGSEFLVNTYTTSDQRKPEVAALNDGGFAIAWHSRDQDGDNWGIYTQMFDQNGNPKGAETLVNTTTAREQQEPTITVLNDGKYVIAYQGSNHPGGSGLDIHGQIFGENGEAQGAEFRLNSTINSNQEKQAITALSGGGFIATWHSWYQDGDNENGIIATIFDAEGTAVSDEIRINSTTDRSQEYPAIAELSDGSIVATWQSYKQDGSDWGVYAQKLDSNGNLLGKEIQVNTHTSSNQQRPDVIVLENGDFMIAWQSYNQDGSNEGIYGQRFTAEGSKVGQELQINTYTNNSQSQVELTSYGAELQDLSSLGILQTASPVSLNVTVDPTNDHPELTGNAGPLSGGTEGQTIHITAEELLNGYTDVDGDVVTVAGAVKLVDEAVGTLNGNAANGWVFTPAADFKGTVDLAFEVTDGSVTVADHTSFSVGQGTGGLATDQRDNIVGTEADDTIRALADSDIVDGMSGDDYIEGGEGADVLRGGGGNDVLIGDADEDRLFGGIGNDTLKGGAGSDRMFGHRGDDYMEGGVSSDILSGDGGNDYLDGGDDSDQLKGGEGNDLLKGQAGDDVLIGGDGDDWIIGGSGEDDVRGDGGNDTIIMMGGSATGDEIDGGAGRDVLIAGSQDNSNYNDSGKGIDLQNTAITNVEQLAVPAAHNRSSYRGSATSGITISASQLNDFDGISIYTDAEETFAGSKVTLSSLVTQGVEAYAYLNITGDGSIDLSNPRFDAGSSFRLSGDAGKQDFKGDERNNWLSGGKGNDTLRGGAGDDQLVDNEGNDRLFGGEGNDLIQPGGGTDHIDGGAGNDTVELDFKQDQYQGWPTYDYASPVDGKGGVIYDTISGGEGNNDVLRIHGNRDEIDLRGANISGFEKLEIGTGANIRLSTEQFGQFREIGRTGGYEDDYNFALDLAEGETLNFTTNVGLNSAVGEFSITGTGFEGFTDTLAINTDTSVDLSNATLNSVEALQINRGSLRIKAEQWNEFSDITARGDQEKEIIITDATGIELDKFRRLGDSNTTIKLALSVDQINTPEFDEFASYFNDANNSSVNIEVLGSGTINKQSWPKGVIFDPGNADFEHIEISGDGDDNSFDLRLLGPFTLNGEDGEDTLKLEADSDLTRGTLNSIEILDVNGFEASLSSTQFNALDKATGSGNIRITDPGRIYVNNVDPSGSLRIIQPLQNGAEILHDFGTDSNDTMKADSNSSAHDRLYGLNGDDVLRGYHGNDVLSGGAGDDVLWGGSGNNTAVFSGERDDYHIDYTKYNNQFYDYETRTYRWGRVEITHLEGGIDGNDTLYDIQKLIFGDIEVEIDDVQDSYNPHQEATSELGKKVQGVIDINPTNHYASGDKDNWSIELIEGTAVSISKTVGIGSEVGGEDTPAKLQLSGDIYMPYYIDQGYIVDINDTKTHNYNITGTLGAEYEVSMRVVDQVPGNDSTTYELRHDEANPIGTDPETSRQISGFIGFQEWGNGGIAQWDVQEEDWYKVDLVKGTQYEFKALGASSLPASGLNDPYMQMLADPKLTLIDNYGEEVQQGQVSGLGGDPSMVYRAQRSGTYYLSVGSESGLMPGAYKIRSTSLDSIGGDINTNGTLSLSRAIDGNIDYSGDQDWYAISLEAGERLEIDLEGKSTNSGSLRDPWLAVYSSSGQLLVSDNNDGYGLNSRLSWAAPTQGTYYVAAGSLGNQSGGSFVLEAKRKEDDAADRLSSAFSYAVVAPGTSKDGELEIRGDRDWYQTVLQANQTYKISLDGLRTDTNTDYGQLRDPALALRDVTGRLLEFDDDDGALLNSELFFTPTSTGRFYLEAQDATDRHQGWYRLSVEEAVDDYGNNVSSAHSLDVSDTEALSGRIDRRGDVDVFAVALEQGITYEFGLQGMSSNNGSLADPSLRLLDETGALISGDDNAGIGNDARFFYTSTGDQTLYLEAGAAKGQHGNYSLVVNKTDLPPDDYGDDPTTTENLSLGGTRKGQILTPGDSDWFRVSLEEGQHYRFRMDGIDSGNATLENPIEDPRLSLYDIGGNLLKTEDHGTLTRDAALGFIAPSTGTYYIAAEGSTNSDTGSYMLHSFAPDEAGASLVDAAVLQLGEAQQAGIQSDDDRDFFRFTAVAGEVYTLKVNTAAEGISEQDRLPIAITELFDSTMTSLTAADGRFTEHGSASVAFTAAESGTYGLAVSGYRGQTGAYEISLETGNTADLAGETTETSLSLDVGSSELGAIEVIGDKDWYSVDIKAGHTYRFQLASEYDGVNAPLVDPFLRLLGENELGEITQIDENNNRDTTEGISLDSMITYTSDEDKTIYLEASAGLYSYLDDNGDLQTMDKWHGAYLIEATDLGNLETDDHVNEISGNPEVLHAGQPKVGTIETNSDVDLFTINLEAGVNYQVLVRGETGNGGTLVDPQFRILDADGVAVAAAFDGIGNPDAASTIQVLNDNTYYLEVAAAELDGNIGSYTAELVQLAEAASDPDDLPANTTTTETLSSGTPLTSKITHADDIDWIKIELEADKLYVFDAKPRIVDTVGAWNPELELIDENGVRLTSDQDSGQGQAARIVHKAEATGTYYLSVRSQDGSQGTYELSKKELISGNSDPLMANQWHLNNPNGLDLNLDAVWKDYQGDGVIVGVIDDGINYGHPDLYNQLNKDWDAGQTSGKYGTKFHDAYLNIPKETGHGTAVSGVIVGERFNEIGISGIAYEGKVAGFEVDWSIPSLAAMLRLQVQKGVGEIDGETNTYGGIDITNNSWGFTCNFCDDFDSPLLSPLGDSLKYGVTDGRNGLGVNWVFAAGNSRTRGDNTNYHNFQNSRFVTTVAATDHQGDTSYFSTPGASILVSAFGQDVFTSSLYGWKPAAGTSFSAPIVSGVIGLMLEANPVLGYRDVQSILAYSARQETSEGFKFNAASNWNGGGLHISHDQGFGLVDAHGAVRLAESWGKNSKTAENEQTIAIRRDSSGLIPDGPDQVGSATSLDFDVVVERELDVEWAEVEIDIRHKQISDLEVELVSPGGTVARLIDHPYGGYGGVRDRIIFTTSASLFRGESSVGNWTVRFTDTVTGEQGEVRQWGLKLHGSNSTDDDVYIYTDEFGKIHSESRSILSDAATEDGSSNYDTLNATAVTTGSKIDLTAGSTSNIAMRELRIEEGTLIESALTGDGNDVVKGNSIDNHIDTGRGNDQIIASQGNDVIEGGRGFDRISYDADMADFEILTVDGKYNIVDTRIGHENHYGTDILTGIEQIIFSDQAYSLNQSNRAPVITGSLIDLGFTSDVIFKHTLKAQEEDTALFTDQDVLDENGDSLSYELKRKDGRPLPGWMKFDPSTMELSGEPYAEVSGDYELTLFATDSYGATPTTTDENGFPATQGIDFTVTVSGTSSGGDFDPDQPDSVQWDLLTTWLDPDNANEVGQQFDLKISATDITDPDNLSSVFSAYSNLHYDSSKLRIIGSIDYSENFNFMGSGDIQKDESGNELGVIKDLGAGDGDFSAQADTTVATIRFEVISPGAVDFSLRPSLSPFLETTVYGKDGDQRPFSQYDTESLIFESPLPDLAVTSFSLSESRAHQGRVEINYEINNLGSSESGDYYIHLYLKDGQDEVVDTVNDDALVSYRITDSITGMGSTGSQKKTVDLPRDVLYGYALTDDAVSPEFGTRSTAADWLHLHVAPAEQGGDSLVMNNSANAGFTYFPWDVDGNGRVSMGDAIAMVNRKGAAPADPETGLSQVHDLDGSGVIHNDELMAVVRRIGLTVNNSI